MTRMTLLSIVLALTAWTAALAQTERPTIYIAPTDQGFEVHMAAAIAKKGVPADVIDHEEGATYVLRAASIETKQVGGTSKVLNCLFAYCAGNDDKANVSVQ